MAETQTNLIAAVVLAGGASSRMGRPKALLPFAGVPLAARAIARLKPQAGVVYLNLREPDPAFESFGASFVFDSPRWRGAGPLAGIAAALARAKAEGFAYLATTPCDAPFSPPDLVASLMRPIAAGARAAVAVSRYGLEPMFALWPVEAILAVEASLETGRASPRSTLENLHAARVAFPAEEGRNPFANLNTPQEFAEAEALALGMR